MHASPTKLRRDSIGNERNTPRSARRRLGAGLAAVIAALGTVTGGASAAMEVQPARDPVYVDLTLPSVEQALADGGAQLQGLRAELVADLRAAAAAHPGRLLTLRVQKLSLRFESLSGSARHDVEGLSGDEPASLWYESRMAGLLGEVIAGARSSVPNTNISVLGLPVESGRYGGAALERTNAAYADVIDGLDAFVITKSLILSGSAASAARMIEEAAPQAAAAADGRPIFFRANGSWWMARDTSPPAPTGGDPGEGSTDTTAPADDMPTETTSDVAGDHSDRPSDGDVTSISVPPTQEELDILLQQYQADSVEDLAAVAALLADWGLTDSQWDLDGSGVVDVADLLMLLAQVGTTDPPSGEEGLGHFVDLPATYELGSADVVFEMHAAAPADGHVVFQVWSDASMSIEAPHPDYDAPFVYPAGVLGSVTPGPGYVEALVRNAADEILEIVSVPATFVVGDDGFGGDVGGSSDPNTDPDPGSGDPDPGSGDPGSGDPGSGDPGSGDPGSGDPGSGDPPSSDPPPSGPTPVPVIRDRGLSGMAPFTVHVHATDSTVGTGSPLTASYEWSFGDPAGAYNELEGWNAAHVYDEPGTYQITLTITSEEGVPASTTVNVNVAPDTRPTLYVAANGNDSAAGTSEGAPIRTIDRVRQLLGDNTRVLLRRGNTFDVDDRLLLSGSNIVIGAYGNGADPVLRWNGPVIQFAPLIEVATSSSDITVQDIDLTSTYASGHDNSTPRGFMVAGSNVTVRRCTLNNLGQGMTSAPFGIQGWLTMDNTAGVLGTYYAWNRGRDICHIGNTVDDSMYEHNIRGQVLERVNVSHNNLFNTAKSNIWFMEGSYTWAGHNTLHGDSVAVGPNPVDAGSSRLLSYARLDSNDLTATTIRARSGMEHICFNNNIIREAPIVAFDIWGWESGLGRGTADVVITNNTIISNLTHYRGINLIKGEINGLSVARNINAGLNLETGAYQAANVYIETPPDQLPANCTFEDNCWTLPDRASCDGVFYAWGYWWSCDGYMNESEWGEIANTSGELYRDFQPSDFDPQGNPTFQTDAGALR